MHDQRLSTPFEKSSDNPGQIAGLGVEVTRTSGAVLVLSLIEMRGAIVPSVHGVTLESGSHPPRPLLAESVAAGVRYDDIGSRIIQLRIELPSSVS